MTVQGTAEVNSCVEAESGWTWEGYYVWYSEAKVVLEVTAR